ncbi:MAG: C-terminal binding protein [Anaerolineae bacterium]|jgi:D-3-phosphoglycerate dehydrogenase|nr:C-terminal binding protein [Chloroflexota bacterium]
MNIPKDVDPQVVLVDFSRPLFEPVGFEAERIAQAGGTWSQFECRSEDQVLQVARNATVVVVQSVRPLLTRRVIEQLPRARCLIRAGAGFDSIAVDAATERGMMVCNTPSYCVDEVADHAIALMLDCIRHVSRLDRAIHRGEQPVRGPGETLRLHGSTVGIIGLGAIGRRVAQRLSGWEPRILAFDPYCTPERAASVGAELVSLEQLLRLADVITIHCPLTPETEHLINDRTLAMVKPGCILVNDSRGAVIDEAALLRALGDGRLWAAGLDVFEREPLPLDSPLRAVENLVLTPHVAAYSPEARIDLYAEICEVAGDVVQGRVPRTVVNRQVLQHLRP